MIIKGKKLLPHGGKRLKAGRASRQLSAKQCELLINAAAGSVAIGQPFNRFITILWEKGGVDARDNVQATGHFVKLAGDWMRRKKHKIKWAWVQEYGAKNGAHVHILLHVPDEVAAFFSPMPLKWVKQILPGAYIADTLQSQIIAYSQSQEHLADAYEAALWGKVHYMLKCAPHDLEARLDMTGLGHVRWGQSGVVYGKRLGIWQERKR